MINTGGLPLSAWKFGLAGSSCVCRAFLPSWWVTFIDLSHKIVPDRIPAWNESERWRLPPFLPQGSSMAADRDFPRRPVVLS
jgi:hypothetical protein